RRHAAGDESTTGRGGRRGAEHLAHRHRPRVRDGNVSRAHRAPALDRFTCRSREDRSGPARARPHDSRTDAGGDRRALPARRARVRPSVRDAGRRGTPVDGAVSRPVLGGRRSAGPRHAHRFDDDDGAIPDRARERDARPVRGRRLRDRGLAAPRRRATRGPRGQERMTAPAKQQGGGGDQASNVVLVDGSNVAHSTEGERAQVSNIVAIRDKLREEGLEPIIVADAALRHQIDDANRHEQLNEYGKIRRAPAGTDADYFILSFARELNASIVSNDRFRDRLKDFAEGRDRVIRYMIVQDEVVLERRTKRRGGNVGTGGGGGGGGRGGAKRGRGPKK